MTILEKWRFMMLSFADIKAAVIEKGGNISADKGYNRYANAIRQLYSDTYTDEYAYPERLPIAISGLRQQKCRSRLCRGMACQEKNGFCHRPGT